MKTNNKLYSSFDLELLRQGLPTRNMEAISGRRNEGAVGTFAKRVFR